MKKPIGFLPFIYIYKMILIIIKLPLTLTKYTSLGFFFIGYLLISLVVNVFVTLTRYILIGIVYLSYFVHITVNKLLIVALVSFLVYAVNGITVFSYLVYKYVVGAIGIGLRFVLKGVVWNSFILYSFLKLVCFGLFFPIVLIYRLIYKILSSAISFIKNFNKTQEEYDRKKKEKELLEKRQLEIVQQYKEDVYKRKKLGTIDVRKKRKLNDEYLNENVAFEKKTIEDYINEYLKYIKDIPQNIKNFFVDKYNNLSIVKNAKNSRDINRQILLLNFEGDDALKSDTKGVYEFVGKNADGKVVKGYFEAFSKLEVHSFLLSEGFEVYSIRTNRLISFLHGGETGGHTKLKTKDLVFFLTQLSTYIKSGIPLVESLKILSRQYRNKAYKRLFRTIIYDLTMGFSFSDSLTKQGTSFPRLLINMVKAAEMTGELPEALDDMADYYTETEKTRKQMITALMYPTIIFVISVAVITFIMVFVIPKFVDIYESMDSSQIPAFTRIVIATSAYLQKNVLWLFLSIIVFFAVIRYLYLNVKLIRTLMQWVMMHMPVFGNVIIFNEVTMFTKTFSSLLSHNVFITDSMEVLNKITNNEIYKMLILDTITNLARGDRISLAFKDNWAFPIPAYEMLVTGEKTGQLAEMMGKVAVYYQELHKESVTRIKTFIEPILIIFLTAVVGAIILSIVIPMFSMYTTIQQ